MSASFYVSLSSSVSVCLPLSLHLPLSLPHLPLSLSVFLCLSISSNVSLHLPLSLFVFLCLSISLYVSSPPSFVSLRLPLSLYLPQYLCPHLSSSILSLSFCLPLALCESLCVVQGISIFVSLCSSMLTSVCPPLSKDLSCLTLRLIIRAWHTDFW